MAIYKDIKHSFDGDNVTYTYHRIVSVTIVTNLHNIIEVHSYRNQERRDVEKKEIISGSEITVYREVEYIAMPYVQDCPVVAAYEYLKTLPKFQGATDIFEEGQEQQVVEILK